MAATPSALEIARALIRCRSVTPEDGGALPYLRDLLTQAGFAAELITFEAPGTPAVLNLHARFGSGRPNLAFAGHTDVVPPGDVKRWRFDPFAAEIADGELWGRGACDMKGGVAAAVAAALRFIAKGPFAGSISFLITGDEEGPAVNGTVKLLDWALARGELFDHCIVGEPTCVSALGDTIKHGRRGSLNGRLTIHGRQGHVAYPQIAENPIRALAPVLTALLRAAARSGKRRLRALEPRSHQRRRRQPGGTTSFRARSGSPSTSASTISGRPNRSRRRSRGGSRRRPGARARRSPSSRPTRSRFSPNPGRSPISSPPRFKT